MEACIQRKSTMDRVRLSEFTINKSRHMIMHVPTGWIYKFPLGPDPSYATQPEFHKSSVNGFFTPFEIKEFARAIAFNIMKPPTGKEITMREAWSYIR